MHFIYLWYNNVILLYADAATPRAAGVEEEEWKKNGYCKAGGGGNCSSPIQSIFHPALSICSSSSMQRTMTQYKCAFSQLEFVDWTIIIVEMHLTWPRSSSQSIVP